MKINWKDINLSAWIFILVANILFNIWFLIEASKDGDSWSLGMFLMVFIYYFAPFAIVLSSIILAFLKSKYVKVDYKLLSILFIIVLYVFSFIYVVYIK